MTRLDGGMCCGTGQPGERPVFETLTRMSYLKSVGGFEAQVPSNLQFWSIHMPQTDTFINHRRGLESPAAAHFEIPRKTAWICRCALGCYGLYQAACWRSGIVRARSSSWDGIDVSVRYSARERSFSNGYLVANR